VTGVRRYVLVAMVVFVSALALGALVDAAQVGRVASLVVGVAFIAVVVPVAAIAVLLRRRH
jgi:hypothetical protein